jgi:hypothetical protein
MGRMRHHEFGEGGYDESEKLIQQLLAEANGKPVAGDIVAVAGKGPQAAPDERNLRSGEAYVGYRQANNFASPGGLREDATSVYAPASNLRLNQWSLSGTWTVAGEYAALNQPGGRILHRFHARDLHLVMGPSRDGKPIRFRVTLDGAAPGASHGTDIDADGMGTVTSERLYQLIRQESPIGDRSFEIEFLDPGARAYAFTFG